MKLTLTETQTMKKRETNDEFIHRLMTFPKSGLMMQVFIITAIDTYSRRIINMTHEELQKEVGMMVEERWQDCALEFQEEMEKRFKA